MKCIIKDGNEKYRSGDYRGALNLYFECLRQDKSLAKELGIELNISLCKNRIRNAFKGVKIVVYSCLVGDYECLKEPDYIDPSVRYVLFTDNPDLKSEKWEVVTFDTLGLNPRRASRLPKLLPHRYLPEHEISVYLDHSLALIECDIEGMICDTLQGFDIAAYPHFERNCIYDEIEECVKLNKSHAKNSRLFAKRLKKELFPSHWGLLENAFLVRRNSPLMQSINEMWFREYISGEERDQFSLMYVLWRTQTPHAVIKNANNFRKSPYLHWTKHHGSSSSSFETNPKLIESAFPFLKRLVPAKLVDIVDDSCKQIQDVKCVERTPKVFTELFRDAISAVVLLEMQRSVDAPKCRKMLAQALFPQAVEFTLDRTIKVAFISSQAFRKKDFSIRKDEPIAYALEKNGIHVTFYPHPPTVDNSARRNINRQYSVDLNNSPTVLDSTGSSDLLYQQVKLAILDGCTHIFTDEIEVAGYSVIADMPTIFIGGLVNSGKLSDPLYSFVFRSPALLKYLVLQNHTTSTQLGLPLMGMECRTIVLSDLELNRDGIESVLQFLRGPKSLCLTTIIHAKGKRTTNHQSCRPTMQWFYGSENQIGWAYGINSHRLSSRITSVDHVLGDQVASPIDPPEVGLAFDALILERVLLGQNPPRRMILRIGGPNPLRIVAGGNRALLQSKLNRADSLIVLSPQLHEELSGLHQSVHFIPNGIDIDAVQPSMRRRDPEAPFTVGMAASLKDTYQRNLKGYYYAAEACDKIGANLFVIGRGTKQIPHERLLSDFWSQIDVLLHPVDAGKEASSNVIMEALAWGVPVVTTRHAGFHGVALDHGREGLIMRRTVSDLAGALVALRESSSLRKKLSFEGRAFVEKHHAIEVVARQYENLIWSTMQH